MTRFTTWAALLALSALTGCISPATTARECIYDAPLTFSEATIRAMDPIDRRALDTHNKQAKAICG